MQLGSLDHDIQIQAPWAQSMLVCELSDRHVVKNPKAGWDVKARGAKRASAHEQT